MMRTDIYGLPPGLTAAAETYEAAFRWGQYGVGIITGAVIDAATIDSGNSPTYELRPGLLLGKKTGGTFVNYAPGNTDGSEVAAGILMAALRIQDFQGNNQQRFFGVLVGGPVQAGKVLGLDAQARQQMSVNFQFDDDFPGLHWFPWKRQISKTANYTILSTDNCTLFDNTGATGAVTLTLPAITNGFFTGIKAIAAQNFALTSNEGSNIVADNNASASTLTLSTANHIIGGGVYVFSNPGATKWISVYYGSGTGNTVTVA